MCDGTPAATVTVALTLGAASTDVLGATLVQGLDGCPEVDLVGIAVVDASGCGVGPCVLRISKGPGRPYSYVPYSPQTNGVRVPVLLKGISARSPVLIRSEVADPLQNTASLSVVLYVRPAST